MKKIPFYNNEKQLVGLLHIKIEKISDIATQ